jgi:GMP synthase-like glutamine amidotransferase
MSTARRWVVVQHVAHEGPGSLAEALVSAGHDYDLVRVDRGEAIPAADVVADLAGLIVLGGPMGVHDTATHPWLGDERTLLAAAVAAGLPVLGVCLGAQQLALALGGEVTTGAEPEIGVGEVHLSTEAFSDPVFGAAPSPLPCMHWHSDAFAVPAGGVLLARSEAYPSQAFRFGRRAYGLQFHVELTAALAGHWETHLPPHVFVRAADVAHIRRAGDGVVARFVASADGPAC